MLLRCKINFAMLMLSIPFIVRATYILLRILTDVDEMFEKSIQNDTLYAPIMSLVIITISDLVPITSQLSSMLVVVDENDFNSKYSETSMIGRSNSESEYYKTILDAVIDESSDDQNHMNNSKNTKVNDSRPASKEAFGFIKPPSSLTMKQNFNDETQGDNSDSD